MQDLMSTEHYCHNTHTSLKESSTPPSIGKPHFYKKILILPSMIFQNLNPPISVHSQSQQ